MLTLLLSFPYPTWYRLLIVADFHLILANTTMIIQLGLLVSYLSCVTNLAYRQQARDMNRRLASHCISARPRNRAILLPESISLGARCRLSIEFRNYLTQLERLSRYQTVANRQQWSISLFSMVVLNISANIYLLSRLLLEPLDQFDQTMIEMLVLMQVAVGLTILLPFAVGHREMCWAARLMPCLQQRLPRGQVRYKIKCHSLFEQLTADRKLAGASIGPLGPVTYESLFRVTTRLTSSLLISQPSFLFQLLLFYSAYFLFAMSMRFSVRH